MSDEIRINLSTVKRVFGSVKDFLKDKKNLWAITIFLLLIVIIFSSWIRVQNLPLLIDQTNGEYLPVALDPFYFLRLAETINNQGSLPAVDNMRYPSAMIEYSHEIMPYVLVGMYKVGSLFNPDITLRYIDVISPVIFFIFGLIAFFFLIYVLTNSKIISLLSVFFLSIFPPYLYRSMAGFSDHESIGMFGFFSLMLGYSLVMKYFDSEKKLDYLQGVLYGLLVGFLAIFSISSWGGVTRFAFMIIPLSFGVFWILKTKDVRDKNKLLCFLVFYWVFNLSTVIGGIFLGFGLESMIKFIFLGTSSLLNLLVLGLITIDYVVVHFKEKLRFISKKILEEYRIFFSLILVVLFGVFALTLKGENIFSLIFEIIQGLLYPFGKGRTGSTIAESAAPYLNDWIGQIGKRFFWFFYVGTIFVGINISKKISSINKNKILFSVFWTIMVTGLIFSRISTTSIFNGSNFLSQLFYFGGITLFLGYSVILYLKDKISIKSELIIISSWLLFMLIAGRGAIRLFFIITPFTCFMVGYFIGNLFEYSKKSKDDLLKFLSYLITIAIIISVVFSSIAFINVISFQAKNTGPSAGFQWQNAMAWVRDNTLEGSVFVHWWDYGHWVTYLGQRPVVTDGGHAVGYWDHLIGRYLLTTPYPETAMSFMKSHNVSYLLIDPSDLGKYPAYSRIGSDDDGEDRFSQIPLMLFDQSQSRVNGSIETRLYQGGVPIDEDIIFDLNGNQIFLPKNSAFIGGTIIETVRINDSVSFRQPQGIFVYNGQQVALPIRYIYMNNELIDFGSGIESVIRIIPRVLQSGQGVQVDNIGTVIYLSPKVKNSLFAQLYLLNNVFVNYPTIFLEHSQPDPFISNINAQGANLGEFAYFNGFRGPIKIWNIKYPDNTIVREEFLRLNGEYAEFDNLVFIN